MKIPFFILAFFIMLPNLSFGVDGVKIDKAIYESWPDAVYVYDIWLSDRKFVVRLPTYPKNIETLGEQMRDYGGGKFRKGITEVGLCFRYDKSNHSNGIFLGVYVDEYFDKDTVGRIVYFNDGKGTAEDFIVKVLNKFVVR